MILYPAVDIKDGQCVRLKQGLEHEVTVFSPDPVAMACRWADLGARWLHVIDLDGAFRGQPNNKALITAIRAATGAPIQLGGGIRDLETARGYVEAGVDRLIIGTMALADPDRFGSLCQALPGQVGVSLDAVDGRLKVRGWVEDAGLTVSDVLPRLIDQGAAFVIYTDIGRDGMQSGVNVPALERLCRASTIPVIAAGGVNGLEDLKALVHLGDQGLDGVISGRAIYAGSLDFAEAQAFLDAH